jgi:hypothetical protein
VVDLALEFEVRVVPREHRCDIIQTRTASCKPFCLTGAGGWC